MSAMTLPANLDQLTADELRELVRRQAEVITRNDRELNWRQVKIDKLTHEVAYYKRHAEWKHILRLLPPALAGIAVGSLIIRQISNAQLGPLIGFIVLGMLVVNFWRIRRQQGSDNIPTHWSFAVGMGFAAGVTTQLANAAGPIMAIYFLAIRFDKHKFIGTAAWYFLILNWLKIPLFMAEGRISFESIKINLLR